MKKLLLVLILSIPLTTLYAEDVNLVRLLAPEDGALPPGTGFQLFHRAGDYWIGSMPVGVRIPAGGIALDRYNPDRGEIFRLLLASPAEAEKLAGRVHLLYRDDDEVILQASEEQLRSLPRLNAVWIRITDSPKPMGYSGVAVPERDDFHPLIESFVNQVSQTQYTNYVQTLQDFITRNTYTANCDSAAHWIQAQFNSFGLTTQLDPFYISGYTKYNVVGELTGGVHPDSIILITGHYDATAGFPRDPEPVAPGADDNASGTACVLECARILSQHSFEYTIRFVAFAGEEQGLYGSEDYVANLQQANARLVGCFNYDMIAYSGNDPLPPDLIIYSDFNPRSLDMAEKIADAVYTFVPTAVEPVLVINPTMGSSDHGPFWDVGWPAICGIEERAWGPDFNPYYHTVNDLVVNCDLVYATNCTRAAIAALADYAVPVIISGPALTVENYEIIETAGNGNGIPDPGETVNIQVSLINVGVGAANGISGILSTTNPFLTINQNTASFPNLSPGQSGISSQPYVLSISPSCPQDTLVTTSLNITAGGGYQRTAALYFTVSDPVFQPVGPDSYGYYAFDSFDPEGPTYNWIEIDPGYGGSGALINFTSDDQTVQVNLPFTFTYYGQNYTTISVCTNGWIAMGTTTSTDYSNSRIPDSDGPSAMIAPFWEDLSPQYQGSVSHYYDQTENCFIIEFKNVRQYRPTSATETFEAVFFDPSYYPTSSGDGDILFQYEHVSDPASCTIGIENQSETVGLQYLFDEEYNPAATQLRPGLAIYFTTLSIYPRLAVTLTPHNPPVQIPAAGGTFDFTINIQNLESDPLTFDGWIEAVLPNGNVYGPIINRQGLAIAGGAAIQRQLSQYVPGYAPMGSYIYRAKAGVYPDTVWNQDSFPLTKLGRDGRAGGRGWELLGWDTADELTAELLLDYELDGSFPNPFNNRTLIQFSIPVAGNVKLLVYDVQGREAARLAEGYFPAGRHSALFDASGLPSGVYFARLTAGDYTQTRKLMLLK